jgi:L-2,4-diaminobutyrate decarboxylase
MHHRDRATEDLTELIVGAALERVRLDPPPLDAPRAAEDLRADVGPTITPHGIGGPGALARFLDVLAPACLSVDHPLFLSFVPGAPTEAAVLFDLLVSASSIYGGSWLEGAGAVYAENEALAWLGSLAGFPNSAGGVFVAGGTAGNLSALVAARHRWRARGGTGRAVVVSSRSAHSSIATACSVMDVELVKADDLAAAVGERGAQVCAVVATGGSTNLGIVDDLSTAAAAAESVDAWFHVDGAYGVAALCVPSARSLFDGIEHADSFIVDPHKWLFAPYDSCALVYRDPIGAREAHVQRAEYLDVLTDANEWNPSEYAVHLSRRPRGLPLWFSLATHGTDAYAAAVEASIVLARETAELVRASSHIELLVEPQLSIVVFRRLGWNAADYAAWSDSQLAAGTSFVVPTSHDGETVLRLCFINPRTTLDEVRALLATLA